jgi:hypothetical protein
MLSTTRSQRDYSRALTVLDYDGVAIGSISMERISVALGAEVPSAPTSVLLIPENRL